MGKLIVFCEVPFDATRGCTANRSFDAILGSYRRHFDEVHCICPADTRVDGAPGLRGTVYFWTIPEYSKALRNRAAFWLAGKRIWRRIEGVVGQNRADIVQLRIPSVFSLRFYPLIKKCGPPITTYIAGDWRTAFAANYSFPGANALGAALERIQATAIRGSIPVAAGPVLAERYSRHVRCHTYFSTTHNRVYRRDTSRTPTRLLYVGRLEPLKRVEDAIMALSLLVRERGLSVSLEVIGAGRSDHELRHFAERIGVEERIRFRGHVSDDSELRAIYLGADILVLPSVSEGTPKVLTEAMAHGVIPIAVEGVGSNNAIIGSNRGKLVERESPKSIASAVYELIVNDERRREIQKYGAEYAEANTLDAQVDRLWEFVRSRL